MKCLTNLSVCLVFAIVSLYGVKAALIGTCTSDTDCTVQGGDLNAVCSPDDVSSRNCICTGVFKNNDGGTECVSKVLGDTCDDNSDCTGTDDSVCSTERKCDCKSNYIKDSAVCKKVLGGTCTEDSDCTVSVDNSVCSTDSEKVCECKANYIEESAACKKVLSGTCDEDSDCSGTVVNSICTGETCKCKANYIEESEACKKAAVTEITCEAGDTDCTFENSECDDAQTAPKCKCVDGYEKDSTDGSTCVKIIGGTCGDNDDCTGTVINSVCTAGKCECNENYIEESAVCKKALGQTCTDQDTCVSNAECDEECTCSSGFTNSNGFCAAESSATSVWMASSLLVTALLIYLPRFILW